ncbi:MAG TPA: DUF2752 domain-containing protein [Sedimentisphaerales bacterium]|nr:DUF2752 domain-containing protein [Sedimentisphaerales bacterium]
MKIEIVHISRRPPWPLWAVLIVLIWSICGVALVWLSAHFHRPVQLCLVKHLTGVPCPTCGFTRGALSLLHGHPAQAWFYNPLLYSVLALFSAAIAVRIIWARRLRISLTSTERSAAWVVAGALFFANWAYIIFYVG